MEYKTMKTSAITTYTSSSKSQITIIIRGVAKEWLKEWRREVRGVTLISTDHSDNFLSQETRA